MVCIESLKKYMRMTWKARLQRILQRCIPKSIFFYGLCFLVITVYNLHHEVRITENKGKDRQSPVNHINTTPTQIPLVEYHNDFEHLSDENQMINATKFDEFASKNDVPAVEVTKQNCTALLHMDGTTYKNARLVEHYNLSIYNETRKLKALLQDCEVFHKERNYIRKPINEEEAAFPIAFSIIAYKDAIQIDRLLRAIYRPQNIYCIHIDAKELSKETFNIIQQLSRCFSNILVPTSTRVSVTWGWFSVVEAELVCMRYLLKEHKSWRYFINLTGQEFPLKTNLELVRILQALNGTNDIVNFPLPDNQHFRITRDYAEENRASSFMISKPFKYKVNWMKGSLHIAATRPYIEFVLYSEVAQELQNFLRHKIFPDETFFQTLNGNPHFGTPGAYTGNWDESRESLTRYKVWSGWTANFNGKIRMPIHVESYPNHKVALHGYDPPGKRWCYGKFHREICVIGIGDLHQVWESPYMFVNKLHATFSPLTYDCLEELIMKKIMDEVKL